AVRGACSGRGLLREGAAYPPACHRLPALPRARCRDGKRLPHRVRPARLLRDFPDTAAERSRLLAAGLIVAREGGGYYDRFRDRIMFPIRDSRGRVVGFGGRVIGAGEPKY